MKYLAAFLSHFQSRDYFSLREARAFLRPRKISPGYMHVLLHSLLKKGSLHRLNRGLYSFQEDPLLAGFAFSPFYYGLQEALTLHGIWEQRTNPVILTTRKARPGLRDVSGTRVLVRHLSPKLFFGIQQLFHHGRLIPVSSPEKTLIDFAYFKEPLSAPVFRSLLKKTSPSKLKKLLQRTRPWLRRRLQRKLFSKKATRP